MENYSGDKFYRFDDYQFERIDDLSVEDVRDMMDRARCLVPDDLFKKYSYPTQEIEDENQNTFIITWNPAESGVSTREMNECINVMHIEFGGRYWPVKDADKVKIGDRFFMLKCGKSNNGIFQSGIITSKPYSRENEDGSIEYFVDIRQNAHVNFNEFKILSTTELKKQIPTFDWKDSTSGRLLTKDEAIKLNELWTKYIEEHRKDIDYFKFNYIEP